MSVLDRIARRAMIQATAMIHIANHRPDARPTDPKVGGHPAACSSSAHILTALHCSVRQPQDFIANKPHAAPIDHVLCGMLGLFNAPDFRWFADEEIEEALHNLRKFSERGEPVFQSYHARSDPDAFHVLVSGSVGIPPVVSVYTALAYRYAADHSVEVPEVPSDLHFWSMVGDSEFREGSLMEAMPDVAERELGNVTWIVDYNRQNLDGARMPNKRGLHGTDAHRIEAQSAANGWEVIQVRHGRRRLALFAQPGGERLRDVLDEGFSDYELQMHLLMRDMDETRRALIGHDKKLKPLLDKLTDEQLETILTDLGGHDTEELVKALAASKKDPRRPTIIVAHTVKGWGMDMYAAPGNHSELPREAELIGLLGTEGLTLERPFAPFAADSDEGKALRERGAALRKAIDESRAQRKRNREWVRAKIAAAGGVPRSLDIDTRLFPRAHTQWMWGQLAAKLARIGSQSEVRRAGLDATPPQATASGETSSAEPSATASVSAAASSPAPAAAAPVLTAKELQWEATADLVLTMSPDVGTSTQISAVMDQKVYGTHTEDEEQVEDVEERLGFHKKRPTLLPTTEAFARHIRFEIAEANCMSAVGAFGMMGHHAGIPFFPIMTVYDFFIKRALDQLFYNLYWGAEFVIIGTPSGVTLSPEGAQHSWKSDIQIPNLITWEPIFAIEMDWILCDAIRRHFDDENEGRRGVLIRAVTRGMEQKELVRRLRRHPRFRTNPADLLSEPLDDATILEQARKDCLSGAYYLVDFRGQPDYEPGVNVVNLFTMGSVATEALAASDRLRPEGIYVNVIAVSSPELLLGNLAATNDFSHLRHGLGLDGNLHLLPTRALESAAELVTLAGRRVPVVSVHDGEAGLLDNIGSVLGVRQEVLAVRKFSKSGRPDQVYAYQHVDGDAVVEAVGKALSETALEEVVVSRRALEELQSREPQPAVEWREMWDAGKPAGR